MKKPRGFLLMEALLLILILSISFVSFLGVILQALKISSRTQHFTEALSRYETVVFELENGLRPDLAVYGGRGTLKEGYGYEIRSKEESDSYGFLKSRLFWKLEKEFLDFDFFISQRAVE